jgi:hypothetical protein
MFFICVTDVILPKRATQWYSLDKPMSDSRSQFVRAVLIAVEEHGTESGYALLYTNVPRELSDPTLAEKQLSVLVSSHMSLIHLENGT